MQSFDSSLGADVAPVNSVSEDGTATIDSTVDGDSLERCKLLFILKNRNGSRFLQAPLSTCHTMQLIFFLGCKFQDLLLLIAL